MAQTEKTHTPGPWEVTGKGNVVRVSEPQYVLAMVAAWDEMQANARLIAAAPELLAVLKLLWLDARECGDWSDNYRARIESLIAKAEGSAALTAAQER